MARPEKPIDWERVDELLMAGCKGTEICPHFDMHPETFYRKVEEKYNIGFTAYCALKRSQGDSLLKETQFLKALGLSDKGDNTLLIWLGKVRLEQKEAEYQHQQSPTMVVNADLAAGASSNIPAKAIPEENNPGTQ